MMSVNGTIFCRLVLLTKLQGYNPEHLNINLLIYKGHLNMKTSLRHVFTYFFYSLELYIASQADVIFSYQ